MPRNPLKSSHHSIRSASLKGLFGLLLVLCTHLLEGQERFESFLSPAEELNERRVRSVAIGAGVVFTTSMIGLNELWYANQPRSSFHFFNDNADWLQMDKAGHTYSGYQLARLGAQSLRWAGVDQRPAMWWGSAYSLLFLMGIEVLDGFSEAWGFSPGDAAANVVGVGFFVAQESLLQEQRVALKFGFMRSGFTQYRPETLGSNRLEEVFKDYNSQRYWLSINPSSFGLKPLNIAPWLNIAVGYSAHGMLGGTENPTVNAHGERIPEFDRYRQGFLSLDVDFTRIPTDKAWLKTLFFMLNMIKMPAPALELSRGSFRWHWLFV